MPAVGRSHPKKISHDLPAREQARGRAYFPTTGPTVTVNGYPSVLVLVPTSSDHNHITNVESHVDRNGATWYNRRDIEKTFSIAIVGQVVHKSRGQGELCLMTPGLCTASVRQQNS